MRKEKLSQVPHCVGKTCGNPGHHTHPHLIYTAIFCALCAEGTVLRGREKEIVCSIYCLADANSIHSSRRITGLGQAQNSWIGSTSTVHLEPQEKRQTEKGRENVKNDTELWASNCRPRGQEIPLDRDSLPCRAPFRWDMRCEIWSRIWWDEENRFLPFLQYDTGNTRREKKKWKFWKFWISSEFKTRLSFLPRSLSWAIARP